MSLERNFYRQTPETYLSSYFTESELSPSEERLADFLIKETGSFRAPGFEDFQEIYSPEELFNDAQELKQAVNKFENFSGERSDMVTRLLLHLVYDLEYLKPKNGKNGKWEIYAGLTHPYDDKFRGSDMVITLFNESTREELPIAVDTTTSVEPTEKKKKIDKDFEHGHLRQLKYYRSPVDGRAIGPQEMPCIVLGYEPEKMKKIAKIWNEHGEQLFKKLGAERKLRAEIVEQLTRQVEGIEKKAPAHQQSDLIERVERTALVFSEKEAVDKKEEATAQAVAPLAFSELLSWG